MELVFDFYTVKRKPKIISEFLTPIRELFSVEDKSQSFIRRRIGRNLPIRKYAITGAGYFDLPFYQTIKHTLTTNFPSLKIKHTEKFLEKINNVVFIHTLPNLNFTPRDYQRDSATQALKNGCGVIVLPTSAGKTLVIALIAKAFTVNNEQTKTIILVPNLQLVHQTYKDFTEDYGIDSNLISIWTGNNDYMDTKIVIANYQIILSEKQNSKELLKRFDCCIVDECHKIASAEKITKLIKSLNYKNIFGFTGSLPKEQFDIWSINRVFGPVVYFKKSIELRQTKHISNVNVVALELNYKHIPQFTTPTLDNPTAGYEEENVWLQTNSFRNNILLNLLSRLESNTLILVDRIAHGEFLFEFFTKQTQLLDKQIYFIQGSVDVEEREKIRELMEQSNNVICIAISKIFSTGISIKNLHNVIFAAIGKARIKIIQSIGRSLRLHYTKEAATIFDIADVNLRYGYKHFIERKELYQQETIPLITKKIFEN
jgi:superfamily II DNA or RNA helicase